MSFILIYPGWRKYHIHFYAIYIFIFIFDLTYALLEMQKRITWWRLPGDILRRHWDNDVMICNGACRYCSNLKKKKTYKKAAMHGVDYSFISSLAKLTFEFRKFVSWTSKSSTWNMELTLRRLSLFAIFVLSLHYADCTTVCEKFNAFLGDPTIDNIVAAIKV